MTFPCSAFDEDLSLSSQEDSQLCLLMAQAGVTLQELQGWVKFTGYGKSA